MSERLPDSKGVIHEKLIALARCEGDIAILMRDTNSDAFCMAVPQFEGQEKDVSVVSDLDTLTPDDMVEVEITYKQCAAIVHRLQSLGERFKKIVEHTRPNETLLRRLNDDILEISQRLRSRAVMALIDSHDQAYGNKLRNDIARIVGFSGLAVGNVVLSVAEKDVSTARKITTVVVSIASGFFALRQLWKFYVRRREHAAIHNHRAEFERLFPEEVE